MNWRNVGEWYGRGLGATSGAVHTTYVVAGGTYPSVSGVKEMKGHTARTRIAEEGLGGLRPAHHVHAHGEWEKRGAVVGL